MSGAEEEKQNSDDEAWRIKEEHYALFKPRGLVQGISSFFKEKVGKKAGSEESTGSEKEMASSKGQPAKKAKAQLWPDLLPQGIVLEDAHGEGDRINYLCSCKGRNPFNNADASKDIALVITVGASRKCRKWLGFEFVQYQYCSPKSILCVHQRAETETLPIRSLFVAAPSSGDGELSLQKPDARDKENFNWGGLKDLSATNDFMNLYHITRFQSLYKNSQVKYSTQQTPSSPQETLSNILAMAIANDDKELLSKVINCNTDVNVDVLLQALGNSSGGETGTSQLVAEACDFKKHLYENKKFMSDKAEEILKSIVSRSNPIETIEYVVVQVLQTMQGDAWLSGDTSLKMDKGQKGQNEKGSILKMMYERPTNMPWLLNELAEVSCTPVRATVVGSARMKKGLIACWVDDSVHMRHDDELIVPEERGGFFSFLQLFTNPQKPEGLRKSNEAQRSKGLPREVKVYKLRIKKFVSAFPEYMRDALNAKQTAEARYPILGSETMQSYIELRWLVFGRPVILITVLYFLCYIFMFTAFALTLPDEDEDNIYNGTSITLAVLSLLLVAPHVIFELVDLYNVDQVEPDDKETDLFERVNDYFGKPWNFVDVAVAGFGTLSPIFYFAGATNITHISCAYGLVFLWIKLIYFFRAFRDAGGMVEVTVLIIGKMVPFLQVMAIFWISFASAFNTLGIEDYDTLGDALLNTYLVIIGFGDAVSSPNSAMYLFVVFSFVVVLVLLNFLITLLGDIYGNGMAQARERQLSAKMELIEDSFKIVQALPLLKAQYDVFFREGGKGQEDTEAEGGKYLCWMVEKSDD